MIANFRAIPCKNTEIFLSQNFWKQWIHFGYYADVIPERTKSFQNILKRIKQSKIKIRKFLKNQYFFHVCKKKKNNKNSYHTHEINYSLFIYTYCYHIFYLEIQKFTFSKNHPLIYTLQRNNTVFLPGLRLTIICNKRLGNTFSCS